jgi:hypothetical protein
MPKDSVRAPIGEIFKTVEKTKVKSTRSQRGCRKDHRKPRTDPA